MITESAMTKRGHVIGSLVVLMILEFTVQSVTNPRQKSTLTSKIFSERMINNSRYYTWRSSEF